MDDTMTTNAGNDSTNVPQPATEPANIPADAAETMLGGTGTTDQQKAPDADAKGTPAGAPEQYDFKATIPDDSDIDEAVTKEFSDLARGMNLTNEQANQMAAYGIKYAQQVADTVKAQYSAEVQRWGEEAKAELGVNETGAGNRIEIIRLCEMLGHLVQADPGKLVNVTGAAAPTQAPTWYPNSKM